MFYFLILFTLYFVPNFLIFFQFIYYLASSSQSLEFIFLSLSLSYLLLHSCSSGFLCLLREISLPLSFNHFSSTASFILWSSKDRRLHSVVKLYFLCYLIREFIRLFECNFCFMQHYFLSIFCFCRYFLVFHAVKPVNVLSIVFIEFRGVFFLQFVSFLFSHRKLIIFIHIYGPVVEYFRPNRRVKSGVFWWFSPAEPGTEFWLDSKYRKYIHGTFKASWYFPVFDRSVINRWMNRLTKAKFGFTRKL